MIGFHRFYPDTTQQRSLSTEILEEIEPLFVEIFRYVNNISTSDILGLSECDPQNCIDDS